jgi:hypothetical protein
MFDTHDDSSPLRMPPVDRRSVITAGRLGALVAVVGVGVLIGTAGLRELSVAIGVLGPVAAALVGWWIMYRRSDD